MLQISYYTVAPVHIPDMAQLWCQSARACGTCVL